MEESILKSTKKILGIADDYTAFDLDILTHINAAISVASQLGVGPEEAFTVVDDTATWEDLDLSSNLENMLRSYMFLKVRMLFDPPTTSFLLDATTKQIEGFEWRMNVHREGLIHPLTPEGEVA